MPLPYDDVHDAICFLMHFSHALAFFSVRMAKGKHAPAPGAVRHDKVLHPKSRKLQKLQSREQRKVKIRLAAGKSGGAKLQALGEKLSWFRDNLCIVLDGEKVMTRPAMLALAEAYLSRFEEELEQIRLKNSVGKRNAQHQHRSRLDVIEHTLKLERQEFEGCGLEMPNLLDQDNFQYFSDWSGELRFVPNITLKRFKRSDLLDKERGTLEAAEEDACTDRDRAMEIN